jgi:AAA+ ATPase superfamily predicted ATPase
MIIGRVNELKMLEKAYKSKKVEFITIYGRRRVGKTYLIRTFFGSKKCTFFMQQVFKKDL